MRRSPLLAPVLAGAAIAALHAGDANALIVTVDGTNYDVTVLDVAYEGNESLFATPATGGVMPWYGNGPLAASFASAISDALENQGSNPVFAFTFDTSVRGKQYGLNRNTNTFEVSNISLPAFLSIGYAQATLVPAAVPGPLPLFGAAAAFGMSRRLRRRIQLDA
jgi:hypothetical protein